MTTPPATPKKGGKAINTSTKTKPAAKKRKLELESDEEEMGSQESENKMSHAANTPACRLPVRKTRVEPLKDDSTELDEEDEISSAEYGNDETEDELVDEEEEV